MVKPILIKATNIVKKGKALDLGAGNGYDTLFLTYKGFEVTAVESLDLNCKEIEMMNLPKTKILCQDVRIFNFEEEYDLINCCLLLHFLNKDAKTLLKKIQQNTKKNGINVLIAFLNEGDFTKINEGYFKSKELKDIYKKWKNIGYFEKFIPTKERNQDGSIKKQLAAFAIFQKNGSTINS